MAEEVETITLGEGSMKPVEIDAQPSTQTIRKRQTLYHTLLRAEVPDKLRKFHDIPSPHVKPSEPKASLRLRIHEVLESPKLEMLIVLLVLVDVVCVLCETVLAEYFSYDHHQDYLANDVTLYEKLNYLSGSTQDHRRLLSESDTPSDSHAPPDHDSHNDGDHETHIYTGEGYISDAYRTIVWVEILSITIVGFFAVEIALKIFAMSTEGLFCFFKEPNTKLLDTSSYNYLHISDFVVVYTTLILIAVEKSLHKHADEDTLSRAAIFFVIFRAWRLVRIFEGFVEYFAVLREMSSTLIALKHSHDEMHHFLVKKNLESDFLEHMFDDDTDEILGITHLKDPKLRAEKFKEMRSVVEQFFAQDYHDGTDYASMPKLGHGHHAPHEV
ncbi:hypothetical protein CYMTET_9105 [Cymbomonas tetramitiformis]|uniref:Voltage-gated hydrogen channel 1 n=1 Tax=Cymbomonas tetramitiformis TaxID=36881 RepID=A0AAE0LFC8_9CHLO|nr:hypothetical protein CYMTET_9105 [Cymbomonas tetramitiformis]